MPQTLRAPAAFLLVTAAILAGVPAVGASGPARAAPPAAASPAPAPSAAPISDKYLALREVAFSTHSEDVDIQAKPGVERAYGVIVEYWQGDQVVTVVGFASGDASVYFSRGGGLIGGRGEPLVASAAGSLVANAQVQLADVPLVTAYPTPDQGSVTVYVLTTAGLRGAQAPQSDMVAADFRLNRLYLGAQTIVSEFRAARP